MTIWFVPVPDGVKAQAWHLLSHYFFASNTAHVSAMYAAFLATAIALGAPALLAALVLGCRRTLTVPRPHR